MPQYQGVWNLQDAARLQSQQQWVTDPNFRSTTLLLQADNAAGGAQNNTFLDSSSNSFAITRNGNTTQGTFTPFSQGWSNFASAASASVGFSNSTAALVGSTASTFTAECWIYMTDAPVSGDGVPALIGMDATFNSSIYLGFGPNASQKLVLRWFDGASKTATGNTTLALNTWYHIAVVANSNTLAMYVNGIAETLSGTTTLTNRNATTNTFSLFLNSSSSNYQFRGYASNIRVCTSAVYTSAFTPSTTPLTTTSQGATNCSLLTAQNNRFIDNSSNAYALTLQGAPSVQPFAPFTPQFQYTQSGIGGSGYFDGTGDYLNFTGSIAISGQFAAECWFYRLTSAGQQQTLFAFNSTNGSYASIRVDTDGNGNNDRNITANLSTNGSSWTSTIAIASIYSKFGWNHVLVTRDGSNNVRVFLNGVLINTPSTVSGALYSVSTTHSIGCNTLPGTAANLFTGYISDVRLVNGSIPTTYQTSSTTSGTTIFTPPSAPLTTSSQGATSGNVTLLTNFTNGGIIDGTMDNVLETVGNAQVSTSVVKYGSGSLAFDGTGDWLLMPHTVDQFLSTGVFTIEMWVYRNASGTYGLVGKGTGTTGWLVSLNSSNQVVFTYASSTITSTNTIAASIWAHIAVVRESINTNQTKIYINGVNDGTGTVTTDFNQTNSVYVGADRTGGSAFNGYLDDLRITKGVARYLSNFTPPQVALPRQ